MLEPTKRGKRLLVYLLGLILILNQFFICAPAKTYAEEAESDVPVVAAEQETSTKATSDTVLAFTSDTHNKDGNVAAQRLGTWLDKMESIYGKKVDCMAFGGDMANAGARESAFWTLTQADMDQLDQREVTGVYTTGNHEYSPGNFTLNKNDTTKKYIEDAVGLDEDTYRIYCLGSGSYAEANGGWNNYSSTQVTKLSNYLSSVDNSKPIIVITHYPLHNTSSRTINGAGDVITALNTAADSGKKIVYLWGHNHTDVRANDSGAETNYDKIFVPGDTIEGQSQKIKFYYGAAGCMSDSEYGTGSDNVAGKGLIITIKDKLLTFTYYDENGNDVTEGGSYTELPPEPISGMSITNNKGQDITDTQQTIAKGKSLQLKYTVEPSNAQINSVNWESNDTDVATVDETGKVKGVGEGTAKITLTIDDGFRGIKTAEFTVEVTASAGGTYYVLADELQDGNDYLIVSAKTEGNAFALTNNGSSSGGTAMGSTGVEITSGDLDGDGTNELYIDTDAENLIWAATQNGNGVDLANDGGYLGAKSGNAGVFNPKAYDDRYWTYSNEYLEYKGNAASYWYEVYYSNNSFTARNYAATTGSPRNHVYIFEQYEVAGSDPVNGVALNKSALELAQGGSEKLIATVSPATAANKNVNWSSSAPQFATVSNTGKVTGVAPGSAVITATTEDGGFTATCNVTVTEKQVVEYVLADTLEAGQDYLIANANSGDAYIVSNEAGDARQLKGIAVNVADGKIAIAEDDEAKAVFSCEANSNSEQNGLWLKNGNQYLYTNNSDGLRLVGSSEQGSSDNKAKSWHYKADGKNLLWYFKDTDSQDGYTDTSQTYKYYLDFSNGVFTDNHVSTTSLSNSSTPKMYLFVKKVPVTGITVSPTEEEIAVGEETQVTATVTPDNASVKTVTWSSSDASVATVDSTGKVTGKKEGKTTITATTDDGGFTASCEITVKTIEVTGVSLNKETAFIEIGKTTQLEAIITPSNASNKNITWSSNKEDIATVDEHGEVTANSEGTAIITVTTEDGGKTATCSVTVTPPVVRPGYVIMIDGQAMSTEPEDDYHPESNGQNKYYGLKGVSYNGTDEPDESILWQLTPVGGKENTYYIQSMDGRYLNAVYKSTSPIQGNLNLDNVKDEWVLDGDLEHWILSGSYLHSTNATVIDEATGEITKDLCLAYETVGSSNASNSISLFTIRSKSNADSSTVTSPDINAEIRYEETDEFENGEKYVVGVMNPSDATKIYAIKNVGGTTSASTGTFELTVNAGNPSYIISDDIGIPWEYSTGSNNRRLINQTRYLAVSNNALRASGSGYYITYSNSDHSLTLKSSSTSSTTYYLTQTNGSLGVSTSGSNDNVRIFEQRMIVTYDIKFVGANGKVLEVDELAKGDMPEYHGSTPVKAADENYTYNFIGWSPEISAVNGLAVYTAQFEAIPKPVGPKVTFLAEDGETVIKTIEVPQNTEWDEFEKPNAPEKTGYTFDKWLNAPEVVTEDVSVTASYTINKYKVIFATNGGSTVPDQDVEYGESVTKPDDPSREGCYEFGGWYSDEGLNTEYDFSTAVEDNITIFAKWNDAHALGKTDAVPAGCTTTGNSAYWTCSECGKYFADEDGKIEIAEGSWIINPSGHNTTHVAAKNATCEETGNIEYWYCETCKQYFSDAVCEHQITEAETVINALGHDWGAPTYTWAEDNSTVTATRVCGNDANHVETETVEATYAVTTPATCEVAGEGTWTSAAFTNAQFGVQTKTVEIEATGHDWGAPTYTWATDNLKVTATRVCKNDASHKETETVAATYAVIKEATEIESGLGRYTSAAFDNPAFGVQTKDVTLQPTGEEADPDTRPDSAPDGTAVGPGASAAAAEKAITNCNSDEGPSGTKFGPLCLRSTKQTKTSIKLAWNKVSGAKKYVIYGNKCGKKNKMKKLATVTGNKKTFKKVAGKKIKKGTYYKFIIMAVDSKGLVVSASKTIHIATKGGKVTNHKRLKTKAKKNKVSIKAGKTFKLRAKGVSQNKKLKVRKHRAIKYESTNTKIATVSKKGVIKAKARGTCYVYAYAQSGVFKKIKVTVK